MDLNKMVAAAMRNGSKLESSSVSLHDRLARETASSEFRERLAIAHADEERHAMIQRDLADRLYQGQLPSGDGIRLMVHRGLGESLLWTEVGLTLVEAAFEYRLKAIARRCRQIGLRVCYAPLMEISADEGRHVKLVRDMIRSEPAWPSAHMIQGIAAWIQQIERADTSGLFPDDQLIPLMATRLTEELL